MRTHPLFPTAAEAAENPDLLYSDHLPTLFTIPFAKARNLYPLRIISWNVLGHNAPSGFHIRMGGWETEEQGRKRFTRIIQSLKLFAQKQAPDVIVLQEATPQFLGSLISELPEWTIRNTNAGLVMLFKSADQGGRLKIKGYQFEESLAYRNVYMQHCQSALFKMGGQLIKVNNVHSMFYDTPEHHEAFYTHLLKKEPAKVMSIVVGDTNTRVAPNDDTSTRNIATGVVPLGLHADLGLSTDQQSTDFPDAAFIRDENGEIQQIDREILNYQTGDIYVIQGEEFRREPSWPAFRMIICLDNFNLEQDRIEGKTVFEFERHLNFYFPNSEILVRKAAKDNNERGFSFRMDQHSALFQYLSRLLEHKFQNENSDFQCSYHNANRRPTPIISVSVGKIPEFLALINPIIEALQSIDNRITALKTSKNPFLKDGASKIQVLTQLRDKILHKFWEQGESLPSIIESWKNEFVLVGDVQKPTQEVMAEKRNRFAGGIFNKNPAQSDTETCIEELIGLGLGQ